MQRREWDERIVDLWQAHALLEQQRMTIDPDKTPAHGAMYDVIVEAQALLEKHLMPGQ